MIYCDASFLVALLVAEPHSAAAAACFRSLSSDQWLASDWSITEVHSALAFKLRLGQIDPAFHRRVAGEVDQLAAGLSVVAVERRHFIAAGQRHVLAPPSGLRAGDALHLALVLDRGAALATLDRRFAEAARQSGVDVEPIELGD